MTKLREHRREEFSLIEGDFFSRRRFLKLGGAGMLVGLLVLFGAAGCGGSGGDGGNGGGNGGGKDGNGDRSGEDKGDNGD